MGVKKGIFIIADITGYTAFLTQSELEHAQEILNTLFNTLLENIKPPLEISNFQGDAIFAYLAEENKIDGQTLLEMLEMLYFEFIYVLEQMQINTTCSCKACRNMADLDLKVFMHSGNYLIQSMRGKEELSGPDVIIVHRMMKNMVKAKTNVKSYLLLTEPASAAMNLGDLQSEMLRYHEEYEHIGRINMYVHDLHPVWVREREKRRLRITNEEAWFSVSADLPVPPPRAWDFITKVNYKVVWMGMNIVKRIDQYGGRTGVDSKYHCAHDIGDFYYTILDWKPFDYYTTLEIAEPLEIEYHLTYQLVPTTNGSQLIMNFGVPFKGEDLDAKRTMYLEANEEAMILLKELVDKHLNA